MASSSYWKGKYDNAVEEISKKRRRRTTVVEVKNRIENNYETQISLINQYANQIVYVGYNTGYWCVHINGEKMPDTVIESIRQSSSDSRIQSTLTSLSSELSEIDSAITTLESDRNTYWNNYLAEKAREEEERRKAEEERKRAAAEQLAAALKIVKKQ